MMQNMGLFLMTVILSGTVGAISALAIEAIADHIWRKRNNPPNYHNRYYIKSRRR